MDTDRVRRYIENKVKKKPKLGSLVRLNQGDTRTLRLVTGLLPDDSFRVVIKAVDELDKQGSIIDISMICQVSVSNDHHKQIIESWLLSRDGGRLAKLLMWN